MNIFPFIIVLILLMLPSRGHGVAASAGDISGPTSKMIETKKASRGLYIYSLSRIRILEGDAEGAMILLKEALSEDPRSPFLHKKVAEASLKLNRPQEAIDACETALGFDPQYRPAHMLLGMIQAAMGRNKEAIPHFKRRWSWTLPGKTPTSTSRFPA